MDRNLRPLSDDPDLRRKLFSIDDMLRTEQVIHLARSFGRLRRRKDALQERDRPVDWPEWEAFLEAAYACGFVCRDDDGRNGQELMEKLRRDPEPARVLSLRDLRHLVHYIVRSERWGDMGGDYGGRALWEFLEMRAALYVQERLSEA